MRIGFTEILVVLAVILLLFGARKLPDIARSLGKSAKELKKGFEEGDEKKADQDATDRK